MYLSPAYKIFIYMWEWIWALTIHETALLPAKYLQSLLKHISQTFYSNLIPLKTMRIWHQSLSLIKIHQVCYIILAYIKHTYFHSCINLRKLCQYLQQDMLRFQFFRLFSYHLKKVYISLLLLINRCDSPKNVTANKVSLCSCHELTIIRHWVSLWLGNLSVSNFTTKEKYNKDNFKDY